MESISNVSTTHGVQQWYILEKKRALSCKRIMSSYIWPGKKANAKYFKEYQLYMEFAS